VRAIAPLLAAVAFWGGDALAQGAHDHRDHAGMTMPAAPAKPAAPTPKGAQPLYTADDLAFLTHMIMHHQQAVDMGGLMEGRAEHPELIRFAGLVADAQRAEIRQMQDMLDLAAARGLTAPEHHMHSDPPMAGMLSQAEMTALASAKGAAFERQWLEGMIFHHEGGLAMARAQELRQAMEGRQPPQLAGMVDDILVGQRAEIGIMKGRLAEWGLNETGDRHAPAVEVSSPQAGAVLPAGKPVTVLGVAVDDTGVTGVRLAVHDIVRDRWLRQGGGWGERQALEAERIGSGPASAAWRFAFTPPSAGRYEMLADVEDAAGKRAGAADPWVLEAR
jgi:uncharacterized protein (DUF305 family)